MPAAGFSGRVNLFLYDGGIVPDAWRSHQPTRVDHLSQREGVVTNLCVAVLGRELG